MYQIRKGFVLKVVKCLKADKRKLGTWKIIPCMWQDARYSGARRLRAVITNVSRIFVLKCYINVILYKAFTLSSKGSNTLT